MQFMARLVYIAIVRVLRAREFKSCEFYVFACQKCFHLLRWHILTNKHVPVVSVCYIQLDKCTTIALLLKLSLSLPLCACELFSGKW